MVTAPKKRIHSRILLKSQLVARLQPMLRMYTKVHVPKYLPKILQMWLLKKGLVEHLKVRCTDLGILHRKIDLTGVRFVGPQSVVWKTLMITIGESTGNNNVKCVVKNLTLQPPLLITCTVTFLESSTVISVTFTVVSRANLTVIRSATGKGRYISACTLNVVDGLNAKVKYLKEHEKSHKKELPYSCDLCGQRFLWMSGVKRHKEKEH